MPKPAETIETQTEIDLDSMRVADYLRTNPDFLDRHPEVLAQMGAPKRFSDGEPVIDMQQFLLERMQSEMGRLQFCASEIIAASRSNMSIQARSHAAALAMIGASELDQFLEIISEELPVLLDIDVVTIGFELQGPVRHELQGVLVRRLPTGTVNALIGPGQDVMLEGEAFGSSVIYAGASGLVRSQALVRLHETPSVPAGMLALGSREAGLFQPGQGTELLCFLAHVAETLLQKWLQPTS